SARVVLRGSYVDEHSALLKCVHSPIENMRKHLSLKARQALRDVLEDSRAEDVKACVDKTRPILTRFLREPNHSAAGSDLHGSISPRILHRHHRHSCHATSFAMKPKQLVKVCLKERVAVHNQEVRNVLEVMLRQL